MAGKFTSPQQSLRGSHLTSNARVFEYTEQDVKNLPESWDWRDHGAVNPPKDQAICGSCWSFGTVGTLEGSYFVKTGKLMKFSEQALVDCSWGYGNNGCDGGEEWRSVNIWEYRNKGCILNSILTGLLNGCYNMEAFPLMNLMEHTWALMLGVTTTAQELR